MSPQSNLRPSLRLILKIPVPSQTRAIRPEQGRSDEAIDLLNRALDLVPAVEASNNLGVALMDKGRYGKAAALLQPLANGDGGGQKRSRISVTR